MEEFKLRKNAEITVRSLSSKDKVLETRGIFEGYTSLNQMSALILRLPEKKNKKGENIRLIPEHMTLSIDIHKNGKPDEKHKRQKDKQSSHYV